MKAILDPQQLAAIVARSAALHPEAKALWGGMTVSGMLYHCTLITNRIMAVAETTRPPTAKERALKVVFHLMRKLPQGVKTGNELLAPAPENLDFGTELAAFVAAATQFAHHPKPLQAVHPVFGPLNTREWRRFAWLHTDHHLRQFGA